MRMNINTKVTNNMVISNAKVYGIDESVRASKYPMRADVSTVNDEITGTVENLAKAAPGTGHDNFLNGIIAQFDLTFTVKAWTELERYHFIDFVSSQSTMHRIMKLSEYSGYTDKRALEIMEQLKEDYNNNPTAENYLKVLYTNPCGCKLTARMTTNYRQLKTIYLQRKNHRLPEWRELCKELKSLPHSGWITGEDANE